MKMFTDRRILVRLVNFQFSSNVFETLLKLSHVCPNVRLEAVEFHTQRPMPVRLCCLDFNWLLTNQVNAHS